MSTLTTRGTVVDVNIESIAVGGDGVARTGGLVIFVPRTAPGDRARIQITPAKRFARGNITELLEPSPLRVAPACHHYGVDRCGGCQLQHMRYDAQLAAKARIVHDTLSRIGKRDVAPPSVRPSEREWRYRTKLTLAMRRGSDGWVMGLHPYDDPGAIFHLEDCPITDERVLAIWREIKAAAAHLPRARELRGSVRLSASGNAVVIEGGAQWPESERFFQALPSATSLSWIPAAGRRRQIAERRAVPAAASFAQINPGVAAELRTHVLGRVMAWSPATVIDAYAGVGDTAVALAEAGAGVTAIEVDRDAAARCAARLPIGSQALTGRVEDLLPAQPPADVVLLNPPRAGLHERVSTVLQSEARPPRAILYVSCNPATLARDLARMPRYRVASLLAFDMFPQTAHVETVCELVGEST